MARKLLALVAIMVPLALAACGDDDEATTAASEDTTTTEEATETTTTSGGGETVAITETDFAIDPSDPAVKAGLVTFDITNDGATVHNLEIEGDGVEEVSDDLNPGDTGQLAVDLAAGSYEMYCNIGNHADLGMEGTVTVE